MRWWVHTLTMRLGVWQWLRTRITFSKNLNSPIFFNLSNIFYRLEVGGELRMKSCVSIIFPCKSCGGGLASNLECDFIVWGSETNQTKWASFQHPTCNLSLEVYIGNRKYWLPSVGNVFAQGSHGRENFSHILWTLFKLSVCSTYLRNLNESQIPSKYPSVHSRNRALSNSEEEWAAYSEVEQSQRCC